MGLLVMLFMIVLFRVSSPFFVSLVPFLCPSTVIRLQTLSQPKRNHMCRTGRYVSQRQLVTARTRLGLVPRELLLDSEP